ncbi:MAG TPA: hypothetical protein DCG53_12595 [Syntrophus sp. (in: bacteria)]|nr:hypothetical protein [Syntrophus sp. (in: bacteria)]
MKRQHLYIVYIGLWICLLMLLLFPPAKQLVNQWAGRGSLAQALLLIYGIPVFLLYLLSAFLFDVRTEVIRKEDIISFLGRRTMRIIMFLFVIIALILLILASFAP